jgi:hypothetical protein
MARKESRKRSKSQWDGEVSTAEGEQPTKGGGGGNTSHTRNKKKTRNTESTTRERTMAAINANLDIFLL